MTVLRHGRNAGLTALAVTLLACAPAATTAPQPNGGNGMSAAEIEALYRARMDSVRMQFTAADVTFMIGMIHHHAQALEMARHVPTHGASSSIRTLAARITSSQNDEIGRMQQWLRERDQPVPEVQVTAEGVRVSGPGHAHHMPGMLTAAQLRQLAEAEGAAFDRLFLTFMIQHHQGAVDMVHALFATDGAAQDDTVFKLASDVQVDQTTEIARMQRMLEALPDTSR